MKLLLVDWIKIIDWTVFLLFLTTFFLILPTERFSQASFLLAMALSTGAHATCQVIYRRHLAYRGLLQQVPLANIGASTEILVYETSLHAPSIDILLYLSLFALGYGATIFWLPSPFLLSQLYALTIFGNARLVRRLPSSHPVHERDTWILLIILQPLSYLPTVIASALPQGSSLLAIAFLAFWALQLGFFVGLLLIQRPARPAPKNIHTSSRR